MAQADAFAVMFLNCGPSTASVIITNLGSFGTGQTNMFCLDLSSNITSVVTNNWAVTVPAQTAYGYKLTPAHLPYYHGN